MIRLRPYKPGDAWNLLEWWENAAEDFSFYLREKEGAFVWLGTAQEGKTPWPLHNSRFDVDEDILWRGAALLAQTAIDYLNA